MHPPLDIPEEERTIRFDPAALPEFLNPDARPAQAVEEVESLPAPEEAAYPPELAVGDTPVEAVAEEYAPVEPVAESEVPVETAVEEYAPAEPVAESYAPAEAVAEEYAPAEPAVDGEVPTEAVAEEYAPAEVAEPPTLEPTSRLSADQEAWSEIVSREVGIPADSVPTRVAYVDTWEEIVHRGGAAAHSEPPRLDAVPLGIPVDQPEPAERVPVPEILLMPTPEQEAWGEIVRREPGIAADAVRPLAPADLASSPAYVEMGSRLGQSAEIVDRYSPERLRFLARDLTAVLEASLKDGKLDALMVATDDGLVIAESRRMDRGEVLAAISTLCESIATRLQRESLIERIEEMSIRGEHGEQIIVRYFPGLGQRYFLLGFSRKHVPYRRAMTVTVRRCSDLLRQHFPGQGPADKPNSEEST